MRETSVRELRRDGVIKQDCSQGSGERVSSCVCISADGIKHNASIAPQPRQLSHIGCSTLTAVASTAYCYAPTAGWSVRLSARHAYVDVSRWVCGLAQLPVIDVKA